VLFRSPWFTDSYADAAIIDKYEDPGYINSDPTHEIDPLTSESGPRTGNFIKMQSVIGYYATKSGNVTTINEKTIDINKIKPTVSRYIHDRVWTNDSKQKNLFYISEIDGHDGYAAEKSYLIAEAGDDNPIVDFVQIGENTALVLCKNSAHLYKVTSDAELPYVQGELDTTKGGYGCDGVMSAVDYGGIAYWVHNKNMYAVSANGVVSPLSANVNTLLSTATGNIRLYANTKEKNVLAIFKAGNNADSNCNTDYQYVNLRLYIEQGIYSQDTGDRDKFSLPNTSPPGKIQVSLVTKSEDFNICHFIFDKISNTCFAMSKQGELLKRSTDWNNESLTGALTGWDNYEFNGNNPVNIYPVKAVARKTLYYGVRSTLNSLIVYGSGPIKYRYSKDGVNFSEIREITMKKNGFEISSLNAVSLVGRFDIEFIHDYNADIDFDYFEAKVEGNIIQDSKQSKGSGTV
jgi:hypothetical protein